MAIVKIHEMLGKTAEEYENEYISLFMRWCEVYCAKAADGTVNLFDLQKLVANSAIHKWFNTRFAELEGQAKDVLVPQYQKITVEQRRRIYNSVMVEIFRTYPKVLFDEARKLCLIGTH